MHFLDDAVSGRSAIIRSSRSIAVLIRNLFAMACLLAGCTTGPSISTRYHSLNENSRVQFIVLHFTAENFSQSLKTLTHGDVSSHYLIDSEPPTVYRLVDEARRAWHAGPSYWQGHTALNASSIGIEIVNLGNSGPPNDVYAPYPPAQIDQVVRLVRDIARRHAVRPHRIVGHSDIQPQTKQDPGPLFPWRRLAEEGLIPWPDPALITENMTTYTASLPKVSWFQERLAAHGFEAPQNGLLDEPTRRVIAAFQMKYRQARFDGTPDAETAALLATVTAPRGMLLRDAHGLWSPYTP
jgi:N-acetylmuramoyl-L-alanine amidase